MADLHTRIREQPDDVLKVIAKSMDVRASEPAMRAICAEYLKAIPHPEDSRVLEVGCGNGAATEHLLAHLLPSELVGIDPAAGFIGMAKQRYADRTVATFHVGDAVDTGEADASFDLPSARWKARGSLHREADHRRGRRRRWADRASVRSGSAPASGISPRFARVARDPLRECRRCRTGARVVAGTICATASLAIASRVRLPPPSRGMP